MQLGRFSLAPVAVRWILANVLPQAFLVAATWGYLRVQDLTLAALIVPGHLIRLPPPFWLAIAAAYIVMNVWLRGAVLRPLVPRFSIPGWIVAAALTSLAALALTASGSLIGIVVAKGLAVSGRPPQPPPSGLPMPFLILGGILGAEIIGAILGCLPGLIIGALEALVVGRSTRSTGVWILWTMAVWCMIFALALVPAFVIILFRHLSPSVLTAIAGAMPILFGIAAALGTLPVVAKLSREQGNVG